MKDSKGLTTKREGHEGERRGKNATSTFIGFECKNHDGTAREHLSQ